MSGLSYQGERKALGSKLLELRKEAKLTGEQLATRLGWVPSKVSKLETGKQTASAEDIRAWAKQVGASAEIADKLLAHLGTVHNEYITWREQLRSGHHREQQQLLEIEAESRLIRIFQPVLVPGLLQTADYARARFVANSAWQGTPGDTDSAVATRMRRQAILYDQHKQFQFLITEAALCHRLCPRTAMVGQLDRLIMASALPNVEIGIIPFDTEFAVSPLNSFVMFDGQLVIIETFTAELKLRDAEEIALYAKTFDQLRAIASLDDDARTVLRRILEHSGPLNT